MMIQTVQAAPTSTEMNLATQFGSEIDCSETLDMMKSAVDEDHFHRLEFLFDSAHLQADDDGEYECYCHQHVFSVVMYAASRKKREALQWLLETIERKHKSMNIEDLKYNALFVLVENDFIDEVQWMVEKVGVDPTFDNCAVFRFFSSKPMLVWLLSKLNNEKDLSTAVSLAFIQTVKASKESMNTEMLEYLLCRKDLNPSFENGLPMQVCARRGHLDILQKLLCFNGIDVCDSDNHTLLGAVTMGHLDIFNLLISHPSFNKSKVRWRHLFFHACLNDQECIVQRFLDVDPELKDAVVDALEVSNERGNHKVTQFLKSFI